MCLFTLFPPVTFSHSTLKKKKKFGRGFLFGLYVFYLLPVGILFVIFFVRVSNQSQLLFRPYFFLMPILSLLRTLQRLVLIVTIAFNKQISIQQDLFYSERAIQSTYRSIHYSLHSFHHYHFYHHSSTTTPPHTLPISYQQ